MRQQLLYAWKIRYEGGKQTNTKNMHTFVIVYAEKRTCTQFLLSVYYFIDHILCELNPCHAFPTRVYKCE